MVVLEDVVDMVDVVVVGDKEVGFFFDCDFVVIGKFECLGWIGCC